MDEHDPATSETPRRRGPLVILVLLLIVVAVLSWAGLTAAFIIGAMMRSS